MVHDTPERDDYQGTSPTGDEGIKRAKHVSQRGRQMPATALEVARLFRSYDLWPIDFAWGHREPSGADAVGWPDRRHDGDSLVEIWGDGNLRNIGLMNGMKVNKVCDADWDNRIARMAAVYFMPTTEMHWGRNSRPDTHWEYQLTDGDDYLKSVYFKDPTWDKGMTSDDGHKGMICELRMNSQALAPGSLHPSKELVRFEPEGWGRPGQHAHAALVKGMGKCAAMALLVPWWTSARHIMSLPLAGFLCRGGWLEPEATQFMRVLCFLGDDQAEMENRLKSVADTYQCQREGRPFTAGTRLIEGGHLPEVVVATLRKWLDLNRDAYGMTNGPDGWPLSDIGNSERFAEHYRDQLLWCDATQEWFHYNGRFWERDERLLVAKCAMEFAHSFERSITHADRWEERREREADLSASLRWATKLQTDSRREAMLKGAKALLPVYPDEWNANPAHLNTPDATLELDIATGKVHRHTHTPADRLTNMTFGSYRPELLKTHGAVDDYRKRFVPEVKRWRFIEEAYGYSLTGLPKRYSINLLGPSHAGKSMYLRWARKSMGTYAGVLEAESLQADKHGGGDRPRSDLLELSGLRLVTMAEVGDGAVFAGALYKSMFSGGDPKKFRGMFERHSRDMVFTHVLWTSGNRPYGVKSDDDAAYERVRFVKFEHPVAEADRDDSEEEKIINDEVACSALMTAGIQGFMRLYGKKRGELIPTDDVRAETARVREALDPYTLILDPEDEDDQILVFTGNPKDVVLSKTVWLYIKDARIEQLGGPMRREGPEKIAFASAMARRGASEYQSKAYFQNRLCWHGVQWAPIILRNSPVARTYQRSSGQGSDVCQKGRTSGG